MIFTSPGLESLFRMMIVTSQYFFKIRMLNNFFQPGLNGIEVLNTGECQIQPIVSGLKFLGWD